MAVSGEASSPAALRIPLRGLLRVASGLAKTWPLAAKNVQYFTGLDPQCLVDHLDRKASEIDLQKKRVTETLNELRTLRNPRSVKPRVQRFDGIEGARTALANTITADDKTVLAYPSVGEIGGFVGPEFFIQHATIESADLVDLQRKLFYLIWNGLEEPQ